MFFSDQNVDNPDCAGVNCTSPPYVSYGGDFTITSKTVDLKETPGTPKVSGKVMST